MFYHLNYLYKLNVQNLLGFGDPYIPVKTATESGSRHRMNINFMRINIVLEVPSNLLNNA